jgi:heat-inducible transcriptional repressor
MLNERRRIVLAALVEEYVASAQPVASKSLVERHKLGCSPATVRNDLAALEETGYVFQPHVSAGRVPTDSGYRAFVDGISERAPRVKLTAEEREAVRSCYLRFERQLSDLMQETSTLLSQLTSYVAVVLAPVLERARIKRIDLVGLGTHRALLVVICETGSVLDRQLEFAEDVAEERLREAEQLLNELFAGQPAEELRAEVTDERVRRDPVLRRVLAEIVDLLTESDSEQLHRSGTASLLDEPEFTDSRVVKPLLSLLEDGFAMLRVLDDAMESHDVVVRIGHENPSAGLQHVSLVARHYGDGRAEGIVGIIGPTRMDYERAMSAVRVVADGLTEALGGGA